MISWMKSNLDQHQLHLYTHTSTLNKNKKINKYTYLNVSADAVFVENHKKKIIIKKIKKIKRIKNYIFRKLNKIQQNNHKPNIHINAIGIKRI